MSGLLILAISGLATFVLLYAMGVRGGLLTLSAAALLFGGAGYAVAGRPNLPGDPREASENLRIPLDLSGARQAFYGRFNRVDFWAITADSYARRGETADAAGVWGSAVRENPRSFALWSLYATALTDHAGQITPAAELAFDRAIALAPDQPGPRFFKALAQLRAGDVEPAREVFLQLSAEASETSDWKPLVDGALLLTEPQPQATGS
ncbi:tetratricopeptide repeat protein [Sphingomicrobium sediminis]|uniref:Tetratricopeptide repeat protein n=1 Tax=Sphingomicrobium sediminis TaxID=2950949 RepID=A0A9X2EG19_9SPHN|nr:tetratricopeptide repeat protein [Sphingomicrobium sediminis]MCM8556716.1 tetratricopeptide repeat protein [Sphingomicrobium sediminis]